MPSLSNVIINRHTLLSRKGKRQELGKNLQRSKDETKKDLIERKNDGVKYFL